MDLGQDFIFRKRRCSDCRTYGDSLASHPTPLKLNHPDSAAILINRYDLQYNRNCLLAARRALNEIQKKSTVLRTHISKPNILKAEEVRANFQKLRKHAKGVVHSPLQRVEIPLYSPDGPPTGQTHSCSDPTELFTAIINQNTLHFSQASATPSTSGTLSNFIPPPYQSNDHTTAILQGAVIQPPQAGNPQEEFQE